MPNTTPLTDAINALTTYANETTGASDTTLSDAVGTLVDGYGQGSGETYTDLELLLANNLQTLNCPTLTTLPVVRAVAEYTSITAVNMPNLTYIGQTAFYKCTNLTEIYLPKLTECAAVGSCFEQCTNLVRASTPSFNTIFRNAFYTNCNKLEVVDIGEPIDLYPNAFSNCTKLEAVILRRTSNITNLYNINTFNGTPFASGGTGGTIYCPSSLIATYKSATNWSTLDGYGTVTWVALEGSPYESTTWIVD